jgi:hypothetical protein
VRVECMCSFDRSDYVWQEHARRDAGCGFQTPANPPIPDRV